MVDGLERDLAGQVRVVRVPIQGPAGRALQERYGVRAVPTYLLLDAEGRVLWRREGGPPDRRTLLRALGEG